MFRFHFTWDFSSCVIEFCDSLCYLGCNKNVKNQTECWLLDFQTLTGSVHCRSHTNFKNWIKPNKLNRQTLCSTVDLTSSMQSCSCSISKISFCRMRYASFSRRPLRWVSGMTSSATSLQSSRNDSVHAIRTCSYHKVRRLCLEVKREYYQNCSMLGCVTQCLQSAAHSCEQFLQVQQIGFVTLGPLCHA